MRRGSSQLRLGHSLAVRAVGVQQIHGTKNHRRRARVPEKPAVSLGEAVQGWAGSSDNINLILQVKQQQREGVGQGHSASLIG